MRPQQEQDAATMHNQQDDERAEHEKFASFFLQEPFTSEEIDAILPSFEEALSVPLKLIEEQGFQAYEDYQRREQREAELAQHREEKKRLEALQQAYISGSPRSYQLKLSEIAKQRNTIVHLGTGKGKTLIALLCIRHFMELHPDKQTLFLVPSVALAIQHTTTLQANLPYRVETACHTLSNSALARQKLSEARVLVATHGAIHDLFMHYSDTFSMKRFALLVLDECHYATGKHQYATILQKWYHSLVADERPHVLGLTASPLLHVKQNHSDDQLEEMLTQLEQTLNAAIVSFPDTQTTSGLVESVVSFTSNDSNTKLDGLPALEASGVHKSRIKEIKQLQVLLNDLGPLVTSLYVEGLLENATRNEFEKESVQEFRNLKHHLLTMANVCSQLLQQCPRQGRTDKMLALEELLEDRIEEHGGSETVGLVFVERRITALALHKYFAARKEGFIDYQGLAGVDWKRGSDIRRSCESESPSAGSLRRDIDGAALRIDDGDKNHKQGNDETPDQFMDPEEGDETFTSTSRHESVSSLSPRKRRKSKSAIAHPDDQFMDADQPGLDAAGVLLASYRVVHRTASDAFVSSQFSDPSDDEQNEDSDSKHADIEPQRKLDRSSKSVAGSKSVETIRCGVMVRRPSSLFKMPRGPDRPPSDRGEEELEDFLQQEAKIREVLHALRCREINVLIATSIAEEGIDVQACSFVAVFDSLKSSKTYIQMKGRARQRNASFYVFQDMAPGQDSGKLSLPAARQLEGRVHTYIVNRGATGPSLVNTAQVPFDRFASCSDASELDALERGVYAAANGSVDLTSAKSLLNRYAMAVPLDPTARSTRDSFTANMPIYSDDHLVLPAHLPVDVRKVFLPSQYMGATVPERHNMLALMACVRLYKHGRGCRDGEHGLLNDRLLPLTRTDIREKLKSDLMKHPNRRASARTMGINTMFRSGFCKASLRPILISGSRFSEKAQEVKGSGRLAIVMLEGVSGQISSYSSTHKQFGDIKYALGENQSLRISSGQWDQCMDFFAVVFGARWRRRTRGEAFKSRRDKCADTVIPPYAICSLGLHGEINWDYMKEIVNDSNRSKEQRTMDVLKTLSAPTVSTPPARLWNPRYDDKMATYVVFGPSTQTCQATFPGNIAGISTYQDYFRVIKGVHVPEHSPLFDAHRLWHQPSRFESDIEKSLPAQIDYDSTQRIIRLPQHACMEAPMADASLALLTVHLPQFLYHFERIMMTFSFIGHCSEHLPLLGRALERAEIGQVTNVLTAKSCGLSQSYDVFEWLGDGVLKVAQTDSVFRSPELHKWVHCLHEGDLSLLRSEMGANDRLSDICTLLDIHRYILCAPLARSKWVPSPLEFCQGGSHKSVFAPDKVRADVMEAILGLVYITSGYECCEQVAHELGFLVESPSLPRHMSYAQQAESTKEASLPCLSRKDLLNLVRDCLGGYSFQSLILVEEAFTHGSAVYESVSSYQRLEWIGDATLCLAAREYLFREFPGRQVGDLVTLEAAFVSNETLAFHCVSKKLHRFINHRDQSLPSRLENYEWTLKEQSRGLWSTDPPKVLADVVEAIVGAAHVDGGFQEGQKAIRHLFKPIFSIIKPPSVTLRIDQLQHPKAAFHALGGNLLRVTVAREDDCARSESIERLWRGSCWCEPNAEGTDFVATAQCLGRNLISVAEPSSRTARNRLCGLVSTIMSKETGGACCRFKEARLVIARGLGRPNFDTDSSNESE